MNSAKSVGDRVGPYVLSQVLGEGGAGQVYQAHWDPNDEERADAPDDHPAEAALKVLLPTHAGSEEMFHRFVREIGVAQRINHPHLVRHLDSGLSEDVLYYAMEVLPHGSLRDVLQRRNSLPWRDAVECGEQIAQALGALHDAGIIHRDLKPENVFLSDEAGLKLGDFGLAYATDGAKLTMEGKTVGSVRYMAPEQVKAQTDLDGRCDLYALGCLLFNMLAGRPPFVSTDPMTAFKAHVEQAPPRVRSISPTVPESLDELVDLLLKKSRDDRPQNAHGVASALRAILSAENGEVEKLDELLVGDAAPIEPTSGEFEPIGATPEELAASLRATAETADEDEPAGPPPSLTERLTSGPAAEKQEASGSKLLIVVAVAVLLGGFALMQTQRGPSEGASEPQSSSEQATETE